MTLLFFYGTYKTYQERYPAGPSLSPPSWPLYRELYKLVTQHVIHGPCGYQNLNLPCMNEEKSKCKKNCPKQYNEETIFLNIGSYPVYKRKNDGKKIIFSSQKIADNHFVVPYNPYLLLKL